MHALSTAADTLQRTLERYSTDAVSYRGVRRNKKDVEREWRDYIWWLVWVDTEGSNKLKFKIPAG